MMKKYFDPTTGYFYDDIIHSGRVMLAPDPKWKRPEVKEGEPEPIHPMVEVPNPDTTIPKTAIEITQAEYNAAFATQRAGKNIAPGPDGKPVGVDRADFPPEIKLADMRLTRDRLLTETDGKVARHRDELEAGGKTTLNDAEYKKLLEYRQELRDLPSKVKDPNNIPWPEKL